FVGAGLIFVHRGDVRGLTTASTAWLVVAVGLACGANLVPLAAILTAVHLVIVFGFRWFERPTRHHELRLVTSDDGALDAVVRARTEQYYEVLGVKREPDERGHAVRIMVEGDKHIARLYAAVCDVEGVTLVAINEAELAASH